MTLVELMIYGGIATVAVIGIASMAGGCSSDDTSKAIRALEANGFTQNIINDHGYWAAFHGCDGKDSAWYDVSSINPIGKPSNVVVCCGGSLSFKGCTIRVK